MDLDTTVRFPFATDDRRWVDTAVVGTLLASTLSLVVPAVLLAGYLLRVLRGGDAPPTHRDVPALAVDGLRAAVVALAYHLPVVVLVAVGGGRGPGTASLAWAGPVPTWPPSAAATFGGVTGLASTLLVVLATPVCSYLSLVALTRLATDDTLASAFAFGEVWDAVADGDAVRRWLRTVAVVLAGGAAGFAAGALPVVGRFAAAGVGYLAVVAAVGYWSRAWRDAEAAARGSDGVVTDDTEDETVDAGRTAVGPTDDDVAAAVTL